MFQEITKNGRHVGWWLCTWAVSRRTPVYFISLNLTQAKREKIKQQNLVKRQNQMKLAKMDLEFKVFENLAGYLAMQQNDNTKKTPGSSSSCPCWCDCGWDSSSRPLSIFRFSTYHSHPSSTCSQDLGRMRKVVAMSSSRTSLDIGFSLKMDRRGSSISNSSNSEEHL